jgi:hypothetical protein
MLIHLCPKFLTCPISGPSVYLADLTIPELGIMLRDGHEITTRRPHLNKRFYVACRTLGQRAVNGLLIETPLALPVFTVTSRWAVGKKMLVKHQITYNVLDTDHDMVSEDMSLWPAYSFGGQEYPDRFPEALASISRSRAQPRMDLSSKDRPESVHDEYLDGLIVSRNESFVMHTLNRERLTDVRSTLRNDRRPRLAEKFSHTPIII